MRIFLELIKLLFVNINFKTINLKRTNYKNNTYIIKNIFFTLIRF